ncbi:MAG: hypothetical protein HYS14_07040, partial [Candidatus Rokubacteria bacterium]|nr:hypothetical protein [Candidatus Rokubacteria bacterium]
ALQMATVLVAILVGYAVMPRSFRVGFIWATAVLTVVSGAQYLYQGSRMLNGSRTPEYELRDHE